MSNKVGGAGSGWLGKVEHKLQDDLGKVKAAVKQGAAEVKEAFVDPLLHPHKDAFEPAVRLRDQASVQYLKPKGPLVAQGIGPGDVRQGAAGDCYFLSSLAAVAKTHPELIQNAIHANADGTFTVTFHEPAGLDLLHHGGAVGNAAQGLLERSLEGVGLRPADKTVSVTVDGLLPMVNGRTVYAHPDSLGETWPAIMEKAYAKLWNGYGAIGNGGDAGSAILSLTGKPVHRYPLVSSSPDQAFARLQAVVASGEPIVAGSRHKTTSPEVHSAHDYTVMGVSMENGQRYITVRNPWGHEAAGPGAADGIHKLPLAVFLANFEYVDYAGK